MTLKRIQATGPQFESQTKCAVVRTFQLKRSVEMKGLQEEFQIMKKIEVNNFLVFLKYV